MPDSRWLTGQRCTLLLCSLLLFWPAVALADQADDDFNLGVGLYRTQRYETAAGAFDQFLKKYPTHPRANFARLYLGLSLNSIERYSEARPRFSEFLKQEPDGANAAEARYRLGECSFYLKDYEAASKQLAEFLDKHPTHKLSDWAVLLLGDARIATGQHRAAVEVLQRIAPAKNSSPVFADALFSLGRAFEGAGDPNAAIQAFRTAADLPNQQIAQRATTKVASLEFSRGNFQQSLDAWQKLQTAGNPALVPGARLGAGMAMYRLSQFEQAIEQLQAVPETAPAAAQARLFTGMSQLQLKQTAAARSSLALARRLAADSPLAVEVAFQQARLEQDTGMPAAAADLYTEIASRWPQDSRAPLCLANALDLYLSNGNQAAAAAAWTQLTEKQADYAKLPRQQVLHSRLLLSTKQTDQAAAVLQAVLQTGDPEQTPVARYYLIRAESEAGRHASVLPLATALKDQTPADQLPRYADALLLAAASALQLQDYDAILKFIDPWLALARDSEQQIDAQLLKGKALWGLKRYQETTAVADSLADLGKTKPAAWNALLALAETAFADRSFESAEPLFTKVGNQQSNVAVVEAGQAGAAWCQFEAGRFEAAASSFLKLADSFPQSPDFMLYTMMQAAATAEQQPDQAVMAWQNAWTRLLPKIEKPEAGAEKRPPLKHAFEVGCRLARSLQKLERPEDAAAAWTALLQAFPNAEDTDRILDEWAWMWAAAGNYEQADQIYRRLLTQFPDSSYAGQARLSLAESLLQARSLDAALAEMEAIAAQSAYSAADRERAAFHIVEIHSLGERWPQMKTTAETFLAAWPDTELAPQIRLFLAEARLQTGAAAAAEQGLQSLRTSLPADSAGRAEWHDRVWVVLAEALLAQAKYEAIDPLETELKARSNDSRFLFQLLDVQGRRWKQQAPPNFEKAREYLRAAVLDPHGKGTLTAARCQTLIGETHLLQNQLEDAVREYFKVYLNHPHDALRAPALLQAALCESRLGKNEAAIRDFREVVASFPNSPEAVRANEELRKLKVAVP
ncbi:MAG: tetratricopeptide repeat protein [Planctomycetaceae bacterium]